MTIKDRDQKEAALQFCLSRDWFPQVEVDVFPIRQVSKRPSAQTDVDVFTLIPASFGGYSRHVIDSKTKAKESPINRVIWMHGLMKQLGAQTGTCVLKKEAIEVDHRLTAFDLGITHFDLANNYGPPYGSAELAFGKILRNDSDGCGEKSKEEAHAPLGMHAPPRICNPATSSFVIRHFNVSHLTSQPPPKACPPHTLSRTFRA